MMNFDKILKVKFLKSDETILGNSITVKDIELYDLLKLISDVEEKRGLGKSLHKEAFTGIDYQGNVIKFSSYVIWTENEIYKYNFSENYIPLTTSIKGAHSDNKPDSLYKLLANKIHVWIKRFLIKRKS